MGFYGALGTTVGMEIEGTGLGRDTVVSYLRPYLEEGENTRLQIAHDASVESFASFVKTTSGKYILISNHTKGAEGLRGLGNNKTTLGYELVTSPLTIPELERLIYPVMFQLASAGDFNSNRASIHYHVGYANNLIMLRNFVKVALELEPVMYRLGGMGGTFRGYVNRCAYSRPLLNSICVFVKKSGYDEPVSFVGNSNRDMIRGRFARIVNPIKALDAENLDQFWASFGIRYPQDGSIKYFPARYCATNLFAIPAHGTVEFRHCNKSSNPHLVMAIAKFLRGIVEMCMFLTPEEYKKFEVVDSTKQISMGDASEIVAKIMNMCHEKKLANLPTDSEMVQIMDTISASKFQNISPDENVLTHIPDFALSGDIVKMGDLKLVDAVYKASQVDIHNISYLSIYD